VHLWPRGAATGRLRSVAPASPKAMISDALRPARSLLSKLSPLAMPASRCGERLDARPSRRGPAAQALFVESQLCTGSLPVLASALLPGRRPSSGSRLFSSDCGRAQRTTGRRGPLARIHGDSELTTYPCVTPCGGLTYRARGHAAVPWAGGLPTATVANVGGRCIQATAGTRWFSRRAACAHTGAVPWGLWINGSPTRSAGVSNGR